MLRLGRLGGLALRLEKARGPSAAARQAIFLPLKSMPTKSTPDRDRERERERENGVIVYMVASSLNMLTVAVSQESTMCLLPVNFAFLILVE